MVPSKSSHEEGPTAVPETTRIISEGHIRHVPHKSSIFEDEIRDRRSHCTMDDDELFVAHPGSSLDDGRGYGNRRVLSPLPPDDRYFGPIGSQYTHRQTLSLHNFGSDIGFQRPDAPSTVNGPLGLPMPYQSSMLQSEPPLFPEHEMPGPYTRTPPPFPYNGDYPPPPPSCRLPLHSSTAYPDRLVGSSSLRPTGQFPSHQRQHSGIPFGMPLFFLLSHSYVL